MIRIYRSLQDPHFDILKTASMRQALLNINQTEPFEDEDEMNLAEEQKVPEVATNAPTHQSLKALAEFFKKTCTGKVLQLLSRVILVRLSRFLSFNSYSST